MQKIKEKLNEMNLKREAVAEAREEENAEKELEKVRVDVAHELRMAREAEAAMNLHTKKAAAKMAEQENHGMPSDNKETSNMYNSYTDAKMDEQEKHDMPSDNKETSNMYNPYTATMYGSGNHRHDSMDSTASNAGSDYDGLPINNL